MEDRININDIKTYIKNNINVFREDVKILSKEELELIPKCPRKDVLSGISIRSRALKLCFICKEQYIINEFYEMIDNIMNKTNNIMEFKIETTYEDANKRLFNIFKNNKGKNNYNYLKIQLKDLDEFYGDKSARSLDMNSFQYGLHMFVFLINEDIDNVNKICYLLRQQCDQIYMVKDLNDIYLLQ